MPMLLFGQRDIWKRPGGSTNFASSGLRESRKWNLFPFMESSLAVPPPLARHIRDLRQSRNLTLADLAQASSVSRASLSRIENGEVSPTADTLAKLSTALRLPISQLISPLESRFQAFVPRSAQQVYHDASHGFQRRNVSPPSAGLQLEIVEATLEPEATISYDHPSVPGHEHHFVVLEGALQRLFAFASLVGREIDMELTQDCLTDILRASDRKLSIEDIQRKVAEHYNIKLSDLVGQKRVRTIARPRQVAMYLAKQMTTRSLPEIGRRFGGRDHTTIMHGVRKIEELCGEDHGLAEDVQLLRRALEA